MVIDQEEGLCKLKIVEVTTEDSGDYICKAFNKLGDALSKTTLNVKAVEKPRPKVEPEKESEKKSEPEKTTEEVTITVQKTVTPEQTVEITTSSEGPKEAPHKPPEFTRHLEPITAVDGERCLNMKHLNL
ncbi:uncharacterized protein LOC141915009 [Tubulanus polymorphus]|uniref:uncharacterized protein LOC141915009 n=1 Tax=Tubulanus polymorphus TaxID=672921 RepID=UPI003DA690F0